METETRSVCKQLRGLMHIILAIQGQKVYVFLFLFSYSSRALFKHRCWTRYVLFHADYWWWQRESLSLNDCTEGAVTMFSGRLFQSRIVRGKNDNFKVSVFALIVPNFEQWLPRILRCARFGRCLIISSYISSALCPCVALPPVHLNHRLWAVLPMF